MLLFRGTLRDALARRGLPAIGHRRAPINLPITGPLSDSWSKCRRNIRSADVYNLQLELATEVGSQRGNALPSSNNRKVKSLSLAFAAAVMLMLPVQAQTGETTTSPWAQKENEAETSFISGAYTEAEAKWKEAIAIAQKDSNKLNLAETLNQMTHLYLKQRRLDEARTNLQAALAIREKELGKNSQKTAETLGNLALVEHKSGHDSDAERLYKEVIEIKRKDTNSNSLAITLTNLANLYGEMRRIEDARKLYLEALELDQKTYGKDHKEVAQDYFNLGAVMYHHNYNKEAIEYLDNALAAYEKLNDTPGKIKALHYLGLCHAEEKSHGKAIDAYRKALTLHSQLKGDKHPDTLVHQLNLARTLDSNGQAKEAEALYKDAVGTATTYHTDARVKLIECTIEYAHFLKRHGRKPEAEKQLKEVLPVYESLSAHHKRELYELPRVYSDLLRELKKDAEADALAKKHLDVFATQHVSKAQPAAKPQVTPKSPPASKK